MAFSFTSCYVPKEIKLSIPQPIENISSAKKCKASVFDYASHSNSVHAIPERKIKLHFYIVDNKEGTNNFNREDGERYIKDLIRAANNKLRNNREMNLPEGNITPVLPINYQYVLEGVSYHQLENDWWFDHKNDARNVYSPKLWKKLAKKDSVAHVFMVEDHPDSIKSSTYGGIKGRGVGTRRFVKLSGCFRLLTDTIWKDNGSYWIRGASFSAGLLNHEVGHVLGLAHSWQNDGCDDTPRNPNCWNYAKSGPCKTMVSNNMMDYNAWQIALTPCQIGRVHQNFSKDKNSTRKYLLKDWCDLDISSTIKISRYDSVVWCSSRELKGNIMLQTNARLKICGQVSLPENAKIIMKKGSSLIIDGGRIYNDCGLSWNGVFFAQDRQSDNKPLIRILNNGKIENVLGVTN